MEPLPMPPTGQSVETDTTASMLHEIRRYVAQNYRDGRTAGLEAETPLVTSGIVDSAGIVGLVDWLETRFSIRVDDDDVTLENFDTLAGLTALVQRKREE
jgi:acyl carrier protein